jgi:Xaa-Pro aminopeptidase
VFQSFEDTRAADPGILITRLTALRELMKAKGLDAYIIPRSDAHQGEYVPPRDERLAWLMGFTGSAGYGVVTADAAAVIVDGRYTLQAAGQIATEAVDIVDLKPTALEDWLRANLKHGATVGFDPWLTTLAQQRRLTDAFKAAGLKLSGRKGNLIDRVWTDQPAAPAEPIIAHPKKFAGRSATDKLAEIQGGMVEHGADALVLTQPESVCWLLNLRGSDIGHTPVFLAFAIVPAKGPVEVFAAPDRLTGPAQRAVGKTAVFSAPDAFEAALARYNAKTASVWLDPQTVPIAVVRRLAKARKVERRDPCVLPRAIKNTVEIEGSRAAHQRDAVAMIRFLAWLDDAVGNGTVTEIGAARKLEAFRAETGELKEISFDTIAGSGPNGAIVHYRVNEATDRKLGKGEFFLIDSGAQYLDGTTDITRTIAVGRPTKEMCARFTQVLQGHIAIATARFPEGTRGIDLDPLARRALWQAGADYDHGTGHGIGSYLSVHEGPQSISKRGMQALKPGMIISNEPGYYKTGAFGIRLENLVLVHDAEVPAGGDRAMMSFETLTLVPFDRRALDVAALSPAERDWLNAYHARVLAEIGPLLDRPTRAWLKAACEKL